MQTENLFNCYLNVDLNNICRICLEKSNKLVSIFDPVKPPHFSILIMACAAVQIQEHDGLPSYICQKCISKLNIAFQFKTQCENADAKIRKWLENYNSRLTVSHIPTLNNEINDSILKIDSNNDGKIIENQMQQQQKQQSIEQNCIETSMQIQQEVIAKATTRDTNIIALNVATAKPIQSEIYLIDKNRVEDVQIEKLAEPKITTQKTIATAKRAAKSSLIKTHSCETCGKVFKTKPSLIHHIRIHTGERPYVCHLCQKRFVNGGHLHTHMRTHTGEKNHICVSCSKAFATAQQLTKHTIAIHTSERPYTCSYCCKKFASSSNLNTHTKIHTGEKNYYCEHCGKTFSTKGQLQQHSLVHSGEKAYLCEYCNKRFSQKAHLLRHLKVHNNN